MKQKLLLAARIVLVVFCALLLVIIILAALSGGKDVELPWYLGIPFVISLIASAGVVLVLCVLELRKELQGSVLRTILEILRNVGIFYVALMVMEAVLYRRQPSWLLDLGLAVAIKAGSLAFRYLHEERKKEHS